MQYPLRWGTPANPTEVSEESSLSDIVLEPTSRPRALHVGLSRASAQARALMQSRGLPPFLYGLPDIDLALYTRVITVTATDSKSTYPIVPSRQIEGFRATMSVLEGSWIFCIAGASHMRRAQIAAAALFHVAVASGMQTQGTRSLPYWHRIIGGYRDSLRDADDSTRMRVGRPSMLVLDGVPADSDRDKLTKLYDLLEQFNEVPRVVITGGASPIQFMNERVRLPANRVIYLSDSENMVI